MKISILSLLALSLAAGCANNDPPGLGSDHPANPGAALSPLSKPSSTLAESAERPAPSSQPAKLGMYTCSMHPEVVSDEPGKCPKCGMKLVKNEDVK